MQYLIGAIGAICIIVGIVLSTSAHSEIDIIPITTCIISGIIFLGFAVLIDYVQKIKNSVDRLLNNVRKIAGTEDLVQSPSPAVDVPPMTGMVQEMRIRAEQGGESSSDKY